MDRTTATEMAARETAVADDDDTGAWQRVDVRESMLLMSTLAPEAGGPAIALRIRNLSAGGLMGECDRRLTAGERVVVELRNIGAVAGSIAWAAGSRIGVRFDQSIDHRATRKAVGTGIGTSRMLTGQDGRRPGLRFT